MTVIPKWGPRLARLYSADIRRLEALHAGKLSPGASTWDEAVTAIYESMKGVGPVKGAKLVKKAIDYLDSIDRDQRAHLVLVAGHSSRTAMLVFATFSAGPHPDPKVVGESGLVISLHIVRCSRNHSAWLPDAPVVFVCNHAVKRVFEHGHDIDGNTKANNIFAFTAALGYLVSTNARHAGGGLALAFENLLLVGGMHQYTRTGRFGRTVDLSFFDIRTALPIDELGSNKQAQLEQGRAAAAVVIEWFKDTDSDEAALAERIPRLERRADHYPLQVAKH